MLNLIGLLVSIALVTVTVRLSWALGNKLLYGINLLTDELPSSISKHLFLD